MRPSESRPKTTLTSQTLNASDDFKVFEYKNG